MTPDVTPDGTPDATPDAQAEAGDSAVVDGAEAGDADTCGCSALEQCWNGALCVAKLVPVLGGYAIDATEVTRAQYLAWLNTSPPTGAQPSHCEWNATFEPETNHVMAGCNPYTWPPEDGDDRPVGCVDWCDAYAYCQAIDKRLCGAIGGGPNSFDEFDDATKSQWYNACSSGGANKLPYGDAFQPGTCNDGETGPVDWVSVGSLPECQSTVDGYGGVYDLSGNVTELEDSCDAMTGPQDECRARGGSFDLFDPMLECAIGIGTFGRDMVARDTGFRCCSD
ncbi:MAG: hypothetical protein CVU63_07355 [Deltaproteobacteria bacterium HGW-Deltaproteobacteria-20]|nr:MAG: hypothetical protein CVU63_07355 [Deltaproteobacteria bacterium HGW-Deltaproteobacteria-20]